MNDIEASKISKIRFPPASFIRLPENLVLPQREAAKGLGIPHYYAEILSTTANAIGVYFDSPVSACGCWVKDHIYIFNAVGIALLGSKSQLNKAMPDGIEDIGGGWLPSIPVGYWAMQVNAYGVCGSRLSYS